MDREKLKKLIREVAEDKLLEAKGKMKFHQLKIGDKFKIPGDYEDATLQKVKTGKYKALDGSGKGVEFGGIKRDMEVELIEESDYVLGEWAMIQMAENMGKNLAEEINRWTLKEAVDQDAVRELSLYITNDGQLYRSRIQPIVKNLAKKMAKDQYDEKRAIKAWMYAVEDGAKKYAKEFDSASNWNKMFDKQTREAVAEELRDTFFEDVEEMSQDF